MRKIDRIKIAGIGTALCVCLVCGCVLSTVNAGDKNTSVNYISAGNDSVEEFESVFYVEPSSLSYVSKNVKTGISTYENNAGDLYDYDDGGKLVGYMKINYDEPKLNIRISEDKAKKIAVESQKIITDEREYVLNACDYNEGLGLYQITFDYVTDGFKTSDTLFFNISDLGEVVDYCACNNGLFDNIVILENDKTVLYNKAVEILNADGIIKQNIECNDIMIDCVDNKIVYAIHVCYTDSDSKENIATVVNINAE